MTASDGFDKVVEQIEGRGSGMSVKACELKVGDKIRYDGGASGLDNVLSIASRGDVLEVVEMLGVSVNVRGERGGSINLSDRYSLRHCSKVPVGFCVGDRVRRVEPVLLGDRALIRQGGVYTVTEIRVPYSGAPQLKLNGGCRGFNASAFELAPEKVEVHPKTVTQTEIECASGDGSSLTIDFDKTGTVDGSGPCIGFDCVDQHGVSVCVDIEDWETLCELRKNLDRFSVDFQQAMKAVR